MRRREFIALLGGAAVWPIPTHAQQPAKPVVGFINASSPEGYAQQLAAFLKGLGETGYVDGGNVVIEYSWAKGRVDQLPAMAAALVRRQVDVIAATSTPAALAAKAATATIPIVFETGGDPIQLGLVVQMNRPGGNITGVTQLNAETASKRLELLHELVPTATILALLVNPASPTLANPAIRDLQAAAQKLGLRLQILNASTERDFDAVFASVLQSHAGGLVVGPDPYLNSQANKIGALAASFAVPTIHERFDFVAAGGLMSYGGDIAESYRLAGIYAGRVLKGERPADLPVQQATKVELHINLKAAKALGITFPLSLLGRADEIIE
jgi:putative ABC transport system substrate-binding protein